MLLPWPLEGAQQWFEGLLSDVIGAPWDPANWLKDELTNKIGDAIRSQEAGSGWIHGEIWGWTSFLGNPLVTWVTSELFNLGDKSDNVFNSMVHFLTETTAPLWSWLQDGIRATEDIGGWLHGDIFRWVATAGQPLWTWIQDNIRSIEDVAGWLHGDFWSWTSLGGLPLSEWISNIFLGIGDLGTFLVDAIPTALKDALTKAAGLLFPELGGQLVAHSPPIWLYTLRPTGETGLFEGIIGQGIKAGFDWILKGLTWIAEQIVGIMSAVSGAVSGVLNPLLMELVDVAIASVSEESPDPQLKASADVFGEAILTKIQSLVPTEKASPPPLPELLLASAGVVAMGITTSFGLNSVAAWFDLAHPAKMTGIMNVAEGMLYSLNFPAMIGPILFSNIYAGIIIPLRYRWNELYTPMIPPRPDLVTMAVREAFDPGNIIKAPPKFMENMKYHGFSEEWSDRYWTMHFLPIALSQAYQNLWRGLWDKDRFMYALHIADIHPNWREDIYAVAFRAPTVRELGYGFDTGEYSIEDIVTYRRWGGLSPVDAEKAGRAMVAYRTEAEREALRREAIADFSAGLDEEAQLRANLSAIGGRPEAIDLWVSRAKYRAERDLTLDLVKVVVSDYVKGWSTDAELNQDLIELGIVATRRAVLIKEAAARRLKYKREDTVEKSKLLSISKVEKARELGLIGDQGFVDRGMIIGYTEADARLLLAIELTPRPITPEEIMRRRTSIISRLNKARRRWERSMARIDSTIVLLAGQIKDADLTSIEALDVLDVQIAIIDEDIPIVTAEKAVTLAQRRLVLIQQRELLDARWRARILALTRKHTEALEEHDLMLRLRNEELAEYEHELDLIGGAA